MDRDDAIRFVLLILLHRLQEEDHSSFKVRCCIPKATFRELNNVDGTTSSLLHFTVWPADRTLKDWEIVLDPTKDVQWFGDWDDGESWRDNPKKQVWTFEDVVVLPGLPGKVAGQPIK